MKTLIGDVPDDWTTGPLEDVCMVTAGPSGDRARADAAGSGVRLIAPRDIAEGRIITDEPTFVSPAVAARLTGYLLEDGDVVGVRTGSIGRYALIDGEHRGCLFNTACVRIRPGDDVHPGYLLHYLRNPIVREWVELNSLKSTIASINTETLQRMPFVLPPKHVQESIGGVLSALDEKVAIHAEISRRAAELRDQLSPLLLTGTLPRSYDTWLGGDR